MGVEVGSVEPPMFSPELGTGVLVASGSGGEVGFGVEVGEVIGWGVGVAIGSGRPPVPGSVVGLGVGEGVEVRV